MTKKILAIILLLSMIFSYGIIPQAQEGQMQLLTFEEAKQLGGIFIMYDENTFRKLDIEETKAKFENFFDSFAERSSRAILDTDVEIPIINSKDKIVLFGENNFLLKPCLDYGYTIDVDYFQCYEDRVEIKTWDQFPGELNKTFTEYNGGNISELKNRVIEGLSDTLDAEKGEVFSFSRYVGTEYVTESFVANKRYFLFDDGSGYSFYFKANKIDFEIEKTKNGYFIAHPLEVMDEGYYSLNGHIININNTVNSKDGSGLLSTYINGASIEFDQPPIIEEGTPMLPIRAIAEAMGSNVQWNETTRTVIIQNGLKTAVFTIDDNYAYTNQLVKMDYNAKIINGRTLIPLNAVAEIFNAEITWNNDTNTININCETYEGKHALNDFAYWGFLKFNYFGDTFVGEHLNTQSAWLSVFSQIGDWGVRALSFQWDDYEYDEYKAAIEVILQNDVLTESKYEVDKIPKWVKDTADILKTGNEIPAEYFERHMADFEFDISYIMAANLQEAFSNIGKTIKWSNFTVEELEYILTDYRNNLKYLDTIAYTLDGDENKDILKRVVNDLWAEYSYKWSGLLKDGTDEMVSFLANRAFDKITPLYGITTFAIEGLAKITGAASYSDNVEMATMISMIASELMWTFDETSSNYYNVVDGTLNENISEKEWEDFIVMFNLTRASYIELYQSMYDVTKNTAEKQYLEQQMNILKDLRISVEVPKSVDSIYYIND